MTRTETTARYHAGRTPTVDFSARATSVPNAIKVSKAAEVLLQNALHPSRLTARAYGTWLIVDGAEVIQCEGVKLGLPHKHNSDGNLRLWRNGHHVDARPIAQLSEHGWVLIRLESE